MTGPDKRQAVVYFGNDWDAENRTSSHQIAMQLNLRCRLIYIECPGLRRPSSSSRDLRKIFAKIAKSFKGVRVAGDMSVYTLFQLPFHGSAIARKFNRRVVAWQVRRILRLLKTQAPILWFVVPHLSYLPDAFPQCFTVYYCVDKYAALPGVDAAAVAEMDLTMTMRAGAVFVASERLFEEKRELRPDCVFSPHGVAFEHFSRAATRTASPRPADLPPWPGPVVGFFGLLESWIDLELIAYMAERHPNWMILLIGHQAVNVDVLRQFTNVVMIGRKRFADLPEYGRYFDVAILPYRLTDQVIFSNPIKLREYLAMGKPVVSVRFPHAEAFASIVYLADGHAEFAAQVERALREDSADAVHRRMASVQSYTWAARAETALAHVDSQALQHVRRPS
jgi:glycosyltransferase involved in cell wall biosynthesis